MYLLIVPYPLHAHASQFQSNHAIYLSSINSLLLQTLYKRAHDLLHCLEKIPTLRLPGMSSSGCHSFNCTQVIGRMANILLAVLPVIKGHACWRQALPAFTSHFCTVAMGLLSHCKSEAPTIMQACMACLAI